jgi:hypothetical protein
MTLKSACLTLVVVVCTATAVQAVPMMYVYTGNPFTDVHGDYTTSDRMTGSVTLSSALAPNMILTQVTPLAFSFSDGHQTRTLPTTEDFFFDFATGRTGAITEWIVGMLVVDGSIGTSNFGSGDRHVASDIASFGGGGGFTDNTPGRWRVARVPDAGATFGLLSLSLTALGVATRQFKRPAA